jgi:hypothetical protein
VRRTRPAAGPHIHKPHLARSARSSGPWGTHTHDTHTHATHTHTLSHTHKHTHTHTHTHTRTHTHTHRDGATTGRRTCSRSSSHTLAPPARASRGLRLKSQAPSRKGGTHSEKAPSRVTVYRKYNRALTFENICQGLPLCNGVAVPVCQNPKP